MITKKSTLLEILQAVKPGLATKGIIEQFTHFIFSGNAVMTYNDEICVSYPLETGFQCSVIAEDLYKTLTGIRGDSSVKLSLEEDKLCIKTATRNAKLSTEVERDAEKMIEMLGIEDLEDKWISLPEDFLKGIYLCMFSASKDMTKGAGTCIYLNGADMVSSDEARISHYKLPKSTTLTTLIPARSAVELVRFEVTKVALNASWAHFKTDEEVIFSARIMEDTYPDVLDHFNVQGDEFTLPKDLKQLVESVVFMAEGQVDIDKRVEVIVEKDKISCKAEKSVGEIQDFIKFESEKEFHFFVNPFFMSQVLEKATTMVAGENLAYFQSGDFEHVISLPAD